MQTLNYEILLPLQHDLGDYAERIWDVLKILSTLENCDQVDMLCEFLTNPPNQNSGNVEHSAWYIFQCV